MLAAPLAPSVKGWSLARVLAAHSQDAQVTPYWAKRSETDKHLVGGQVRVHGLRLFVATHDTLVPQIVGRPENPPRVFENDRVRFVYRPAFISVGEFGSHRNGIILRWDSPT